MNPDERAKWFADGMFPIPVRAISLSAVLSFVEAWRSGRFIESTSRFGLIEESSLNILKLLNGWTAKYSEMQMRNANFFAYEISMPGFKLLTTTAPEDYADVARLQAKLIVNNFNQQMLVNALNEAKVDSIAEWSYVVDELTNKTSIYAGKYGVKLEPYINAGVSDLDAMARFIDEDIDVDLALAI